MPPGQEFDPVAQDPHRMVQCPSAPDHLWIQHHNGIFRSTDCAATWQEITTALPTNFGFGVAVHPVDPAIAWFAPAIADEKRIPLDGKHSLFLVEVNKHLLVLSTSERGVKVILPSLPAQVTAEAPARAFSVVQKTPDAS